MNKNIELSRYIKLYKGYKINNKQCILDDNLNIQYINEELSRVIDKTPVEVIGSNFMQLPRPLHIQQIKQKLFDYALQYKNDMCYITFNSQITQCRLMLIYVNIITNDGQNVIGFELNFKELIHIPFALFYQGANISCCFSELNPHESEITFLKAHRMTNKEIAFILTNIKNKKVSHYTIKNILCNQIYPKLGVSSQIEFLHKIDQLKMTQVYTDFKNDFILVLN